MFRRSKAAELKEGVASTADLAAALARDKKFRRQVAAALAHASAAHGRAGSHVGTRAVALRLARDEALRQELSEMIDNLRAAWARREKKESHRRRNTLLAVVVTAAAAAAALPQIRRRLQRLPSSIRGTSAPRTIDEAIDVNVPVSTAYNQWTQFEDFPLFMEGVEHVEQRDDTRLHWVATVGGRDGRVGRQDPRAASRPADQLDQRRRQEDARHRHVRAARRRRTRVRLSMSYQAEGLTRTLGSAAGLDARRVRGDLERFKELIESRGAESGAWRGEVSAGTTQ